MMGCYLLACLTIVKANLPVDYSQSFSALVGGLNFNHVDDRRNAQLMNVIFLVLACVFVIALTSLFGMQRANSNGCWIECSRLSSSLMSALQSLA